MKRLTGIVLIFLCLSGMAQESKNQFYYVNGGVSAGNLFGGQLGLNFAVQNRISIQIEYSGVVRQAKETPDDYTGGLVNIFALGTNRPVDEIHSFRIMGGIIHPVHPNSKTRINFKAGIAFSTQNEAHHFVKDPVSGLFLVPNYSWKTRTEQRVGIIIKPEFETIFSRFIGISFLPYVEFNAGITSGGIAVNLLLGKLQNRKKIF